MKNPFKSKNKLGATMPVRDINAVQADYSQALAEYGSTQYQIEILTEQKAKVFRRMKDLNMEGAAIQAEQKLAAVDQSPEPKQNEEVQS